MDDSADATLQGSSTTVLSFRFSGHPARFPLDAFVRALANELQVDEWELQVLSVSGGPVVVDVRVDRKIAQRLASIYLCGHLKHIMCNFELLSMDFTSEFEQIMKTDEADAQDDVPDPISGAVHDPNGPANGNKSRRISRVSRQPDGRSIRPAPEPSAITKVKGALSNLSLIPSREVPSASSTLRIHAANDQALVEDRPTTPPLSDWQVAGMSLEYDSRRKIKVLHVQVQSIAQAAGVCSGDVITKVAGHDVGHLPLTEVLAIIDTRLRGRIGTVSIEVQRFSGEGSHTMETVWLLKKEPNSQLSLRSRSVPPPPPRTKKFSAMSLAEYRSHMSGGNLVHCSS